VDERLILPGGRRRLPAWIAVKSRLLTHSAARNERTASGKRRREYLQTRNHTRPGPRREPGGRLCKARSKSARSGARRRQGPLVYTLLRARSRSSTVSAHAVRAAVACAARFDVAVSSPDDCSSVASSTVMSPTCVVLFRTDQRSPYATTLLENVAT
jgi:hypothetical protein